MGNRTDRTSTKPALPILTIGCSSSRIRRPETLDSPRDLICEPFFKSINAGCIAVEYQRCVVPEECSLNIVDIGVYLVILNHHVPEAELNLGRAIVQTVLVNSVIQVHWHVGHRVALRQIQLLLLEQVRVLLFDRDANFVHFGD